MHVAANNQAAINLGFSQFRGTIEAVISPSAINVRFFKVATGAFTNPSLYLSFVRAIDVQTTCSGGNEEGGKMVLLGQNTPGCWKAADSRVYEWNFNDDINDFDILTFINKESFYGTGIGSNSVPVRALPTSSANRIRVRADKAGAFGGSDGGGIYIYKHPTIQNRLLVQDVDAVRGYEPGACIYEVWGIKGGGSNSPIQL